MEEFHFLNSNGFSFPFQKLSFFECDCNNLSTSDHLFTSDIINFLKNNSPPLETSRPHLWTLSKNFIKFLLISFWRACSQLIKWLYTSRRRFFLSFVCIFAKNCEWKILLKNLIQGKNKNWPQRSWKTIAKKEWFDQK